MPYESHVLADFNITTTSAIDFANASSTFEKGNARENLELNIQCYSSLV